MVPHPLVLELHALVKASPLTERGLARFAGGGVATVWSWVHGKQEPSMEAFDRFLRPLGYRLAILKSEEAE